MKYVPAPTQASDVPTLRNWAVLELNRLSSSLDNEAAVSASDLEAEAEARAAADAALAQQIEQLTINTDGSNRTFAQSTAPSSPNIGDLWIHTGQGNRLNRWNGTAWAAVDDARLASNASAIAAESAARASADGTITQQIAGLNSQVAGNTAAIQSEISARTSADTALASQITSLTSTVSGNTAAISSEATTRANADSALSSQITSLTASVGNNAAAIATESTARANADTSLASQITALGATVSGNTAAISNEVTARANADTALASLITALDAEVDANAAAIATEVSARANADSALATQINSLTATVNTNTAAISNETTARAAADTSLANQINSLTATVNVNTAAIASEATARANADGALASQINSLNAEVDANAASISAALSSESTARANADSALTTQINSLSATVNSNAASITAALSNESTTRANADTALSSQITSLTATVNSNTAAISNEATARANADGALASQISALTTTVNGNTASVNTLASSVNGLQARYGVSLNVNGYVTGFVQNNDGQTGSFTILADRFAIVAPGASPQTPFEVSGGVVRIKEANIGSLNVGKLTTGVLTAGITQNGDWSVGTGRIIWDNGSHMKVAGVGFGSNNQFIEWFGPKVPIAQCTEANAITYLKTNGDAYFGGSLSAGILRNAATVTGIGPAEQIVLGPFGSNGGARTVVLSYNYSNNIAITDAASWTGTPSASVVLERANGSGGWTQISVLNVTGSVSGQDGFGEFEPGFISIGMAGSTTFVDNSGGLNVTYRGRIVSRTLPTINSTISSSAFFTPNQDVTVVSTEG